MAISFILCADPNPNRTNSSRNIRLISLSEWGWEWDPFERDSDMIVIELITLLRDCKSSWGEGKVTVSLWLLWNSWAVEWRPEVSPDTILRSSGGAERKIR
jgi:hypothetical protein